MKDDSLNTICHALKVVFSLLKPKLNPLAFVLLIGRQHQGKSTLLQRSELTAYPIPNEDTSLYYNAEGVILELSESWLSQQQGLLSHIIKKLNRIHPAVQITALCFCIDVQSFFHLEHDETRKFGEKQAHWLKRFVESLDYPVGVSVLLTKCDGLAGFTPFFQSEHPTDWLKPLGFSIDSRLSLQLVLRQYRVQFDKMVEGLGRQVLSKIHAVRSGTLRTQIREFPLQLASLRAPLQALVESFMAANIHLQGLYWMSASSFADPVDRLYHKFADDYGLMVHPHASSMRAHPAYFVRGAFEQIFTQNKKMRMYWSQAMQWTMRSGFSVFIVLLGVIFYQHMKTTGLLDSTSQELLAYEMLIKSGQKPTAATYHLSQALRSLNTIPYPMQYLKGVQKLQTVLKTLTHQTLEQRFLPDLLLTLEQQMRSPQSTPVEQYEALKTYLRLTDAAHFSAPAIQDWFETYWSQHPPQSPSKARALLREVLAHPSQHIQLNQQLVRDVRNHLTALPEGYFYYSLAKKRMVGAETAIGVPGLILSHATLPKAYTKQGFPKELSRLHEMGNALVQERWVLQQADMSQIPTLLVQAYCFEYVTWWKQLMKQSHLPEVENFKQAQQLAERLYQQDAFTKLIQLVQQNTSPIQGEDASVFNEKIVPQFTSLNFISPGAIRDLNQAVHEMSGFLSTLSLVHDEGQTAFSFVKTRFQDENYSDSLSLLYQRANGLPEPASEWVKGLADSVWAMLIQQGRTYLNQRWKTQVFEPYEMNIAHHYPFDAIQTQEVTLDAFDRFFSPYGVLAMFVQENVKPFIDTTQAQWKPKTRDGLMMPISEDMMNELIRANVISNMFFPEGVSRAQINFSLEKVSLDPVVSHLSLALGNSLLEDDQQSHSIVEFQWPAQQATLKLDSIEGGHFDISEDGMWAFFKMLQKVNVLVDPEDASSLQILFEINGNAGRYVLKTKNQINPFSPGILDGFTLNSAIV